MQINRIFGESHATGQWRASKYPHSGSERFRVTLPLIHEKSKHINKISAFHRHIDANNTLRNAVHAPQIDRAGDQFGKNCQAFLSCGNAWGIQA